MFEWGKNTLLKYLTRSFLRKTIQPVLSHLFFTKIKTLDVIEERVKIHSKLTINTQKLRQ